MRCLSFQRNPSPSCFLWLFTRTQLMCLEQRDRRGNISKDGWHSTAVNNTGRQCTPFGSDNSFNPCDKKQAAWTSSLCMQSKTIEQPSGFGSLKVISFCTFWIYNNLFKLVSVLDVKKEPTWRLVVYFCFVWWQTMKKSFLEPVWGLN